MIFKVYMVHFLVFWGPGELGLKKVYIFSIHIYIMPAIESKHKRIYKSVVWEDVYWVATRRRKNGEHKFCCRFMFALLPVSGTQRVLFGTRSRRRSLRRLRRGGGGGIWIGRDYDFQIFEFTHISGYLNREKWDFHTSHGATLHMSCVVKIDIFPKQIHLCSFLCSHLKKSNGALIWQFLCKYFFYSFKVEFGAISLENII